MHYLELSNEYVIQQRGGIRKLRFMQFISFFFVFFSQLNMPLFNIGNGFSSVFMSTIL